MPLQYTPFEAIDERNLRDNLDSFIKRELNLFEELYRLKADDQQTPDMAGFANNRPQRFN